jgi:hypothetical protein
MPVLEDTCISQYQSWERRFLLCPSEGGVRHNGEVIFDGGSKVVNGRTAFGAMPPQ